MEQTKRNPFTTNFKYKEQSFISDNDFFLENIEDGLLWNDDNWRDVIISSLRGSGKTTMLHRIQNYLKSNHGEKVVTIYVNSTSGFIVDVFLKAIESLPEKNKRKFRAKLNLFNAIDLSVNNKFKNPDFSYRTDMELVLKEFDNLGWQLVILIDEVKNINDDLKTFYGAEIAFVNEDLPVMSIAAGLPSAVSNLINDKALSFLRRAQKIELRPLNVQSIYEEYRKIFDGQIISDDQLKVLSEFTRGYPYLYQLIGYFIWSTLTKGGLSSTLIEDAQRYALNELFENVYSKFLTDVSPKTRDMLIAINNLGGTRVKVQDIRKQLNWSSSYASNYRNRLIEWKLVKQDGYGELTIVPPYLDLYLKQIQ
ncbi:MAG: hypothetical protein LBM27_05745 [Lactobacillaceae bacterium]|jgi:hypothetical protein|nr:hypothetical protein [Lactobacillaceae bacterium]